MGFQSPEIEQKSGIKKYFGKSLDYKNDQMGKSGIMEKYFGKSLDYKNDQMGKSGIVILSPNHKQPSHCVKTLAQNSL